MSSSPFSNTFLLQNRDDTLSRFEMLGKKKNSSQITSQTLDLGRKIIPFFTNSRHYKSSRLVLGTYRLLAKEVLCTILGTLNDAANVAKEGMKVQLLWL